MNIGISCVINPERDRISRLPINLWIDNLKEDFINQNNNDISKRFTSLELITNQLALILFIINEVELARNLCFNAQKYFFSIYIKQNIFCCTNKFGILQPWINLIRIERFLKNFSVAYTKVESLKQNGPQYEFGNYIINRNDLSIQAQQLLMNCYVDEKVKLYISNNEYNKLDNFLNEYTERSLNSFSQILLFLEARIISMFHSDQKDLIPDFIDDIMTQLPENEKNLFKLKLVHYYMNIRINDLALKNLDELYLSFSVDIFSPLHILRFWLVVGKTCYELSEFEKMGKIFNNLYEPLLKKNDELSLWEISILMKKTIYSDLKWEYLSMNSSYSIINAKLSKNYLWHKNCIELNAHVNEYLCNTL